MAGTVELWNVVAADLKAQIGPASYNIWIAPIAGTIRGDGTLNLQVPSQYFVDYVTDHYLERIRSTATERARRPIDVVLEVQGEANHGRSDTTDGPPPVAYREQVGRLAPEEAAPNRGSSVPPMRTELNVLSPKYTFDNFVVGPSNQFAHAACQAVADTPGGTYNPLFLFGGVGLGKTHLMNAIGLSLEKRAPQLRIIYLSSESFTNEFIHCVRYDRLDNFRLKYRSECDVLLMDDIQFLAGKERTQTEFFHIFNALYSAHKQIVVTSDKMPQEISDLELRLRSRFQWGLIADIQPPEMETRIAILEQIAAAESLTVPQEVTHYLATHVKDNVRELEGYLRRLMAMASMRKVDISLDFARECLASLIDERSSALKVEDIQKLVAGYYNLKIADLRSRRRTRDVALPRQVAMFLSRKHVGASFPEIGKRFEKDHSTVIAACNKIKGLVERDIAIRSAIEALERQLHR